MNKDKLISLLIRKQTYKDTKPYLTELLNLKQQAVKCSLQAIKQILTTDYNAEAKLYAVRFLKDAFQKGNPSFINRVEIDLLRLLVNIAIDENDQKSIIKYAGSSYTKTEQLSKFKAIIQSMFRMVKECIIKWAEWIPDPNRKFVQAFNDIKNKNVSLNFQLKYFRPQNEQLFRQCCQKNGIKLSGANPKPIISSKNEQKKTKDPHISAIEQSLNKVKAATNQKQIEKIENDFNQAINNYLENAIDFKQDFVQQSFDTFENLKKQGEARIKKSSVKQSLVQQSAAPIPNQTPKDSSARKTENISKKSKQQNKQTVNASQKNEQLAQKNEKRSSRQEKKEKAQGQVKQRQSKVQNLIKQSIGRIQHIKEVKDQPKIQISEPKPEKKKIESAIQQQLKDFKSKINTQKKNIVEQEKKPNGNTNQSKSLKIPTSPRKSNVVKFDSEQSPFQTQKRSNVDVKAPPSKHSVKESSISKKQNKLSDMSVQSSERVNFSDEDSSQFSEEGPNRIQARDFKKKSHLTPIRQETSRNLYDEKSQFLSPNNLKNQIKSPSHGKNSRIEEESFTSRQKKGAITHKILQENKYLNEKYEKLLFQMQAQKQRSQAMLKQKQVVEKQLRLKSENEERLTKKLKSSIPIEDYHKLRQQLQDQKQMRQSLIKQNLKMRSKNESLIQELNETKYRLKNNSQIDKSKQKNSQSQLISISNRPVSSKPIPSAPIIKEEIDPDYIKNLTHTSNLHKWLSKVNLTLFKRNELGLSQLAYRDEYLSVMTKSSIYTQNNEQFLSMTVTYQFKSLKQVKPHIKYKNCQQLDLWSKPLVGQEELYTQQLAIRLHSNPLKVMKVEVKIIQIIDITFLLPILYLNFLREEEFSNEQFDSIFNLKAQQLIKSKITQWNTQIVKQAIDIQNLFKKSVLTGDKIRFCFSEGINDQIFMGQFQILRNSKLLLRVLPIPYTESMISKAKELIQNLTFLLS